MGRLRDQIYAGVASGMSHAAAEHRNDAEKTINKLGTPGRQD
jgi:hypothetical protein